MFVLRVAQELDDYLHLCSGEYFGILLVAHVLHCLPHAACLVHHSPLIINLLLILIKLITDYLITLR